MWTRLPAKPYTIIWFGQHDDITLEHKLNPESVPTAKHSVYDDTGLVITFPRPHRVVLKRNGKVRFDDSVRMKYTFTTKEYWTLFQEDLRGGKKLIAGADSRCINSARCRESERQRIQIWKDGQREDAPLHKLSYFSNLVEKKEVEFPLLLFETTIDKSTDPPTVLVLEFRSDLAVAKVRRGRQNSHTSSLSSGKTFPFPYRLRIKGDFWTLSAERVRFEVVF